MNFTSLRHKMTLKAQNSKGNDIPVGSTVKATLKIEEGGKTRQQLFEGLLIKKKKIKGTTALTLRKVSFGVGVEKVLPLDSPSLAKIEVTTQHKVRRSKLYYLRKLTGKASKLQELYGAKKQDLSHLDTEFGSATEEVEAAGAEATAPEKNVTAEPKKDLEKK